MLHGYCTGMYAPHGGHVPVDYLNLVYRNDGCNLSTYPIENVGYMQSVKTHM